MSMQPPSRPSGAQQPAGAPLGLGWGKFLLAAGVIVAGLVVLEEFHPSAVKPAVFLLLLSVALSYPQFNQKLVQLFGGKL